MAPSKKSVKKEPASTSGILKIYLFLYNIIQLCGWTYVTYLLITYYTTQQYRRIKLWDFVFLPVALLQTLAILEILHVILGFVKTSVFMTAMQILFRIVNTFGVFNLIPYNIDTIGVPMTLVAWCGAELTRYSFHIFKELNFVPYFVTWIRYSAFIVLIPIGVGGELLGQYIVQQLYANKWTVLVPQLNVTVGYRHLIIFMMIGTAQGIFMMYRHMFIQRNKALGSNSKPSIPSKQKAK